MNTSAQAEHWRFCADILPEVSRSFALIIPACPEPVADGLCVAYLICRIADTIEDDEHLTDAQRAELYDQFLTALTEPGESVHVRRFLSAWPRIPEGGYGRLLEGTVHVLAAYADLPAAYHAPLLTCVADMIAGMRLNRPVEQHGSVDFICRDVDDLDRYCHYVAGVVGVMTTALFEHRFASSQPAFNATPAWREQGRRMGLGLQMTNILKDCRSDARRGVSYIPSSFVESAPGTDLRHDGYRLRPDRRRGLYEHAIGHLDAGMAYTRAVPTAETGIRTFLLGSLLPAIATLEVAADDVTGEPKISRAKMEEILLLIADHGDQPAILDAWYSRHRQATLSKLADDPGRPSPAHRPR